MSRLYEMSSFCTTAKSLQKFNPNRVHRDIYSQKGGDFMTKTELIRQLILMVVLKVGTPVIINLTIDGTTHRIEIT